MILSDRDILNRMKKSEIVINPVPSQEQVQPASIDLRLGSEYYAPIDENKSIDIKNNELKYQEIKGNCLVLPPGEFILGTTQEWVEIPDDLCAKVEGRSSVGRLGVGVHVTAGFIDPGFKGKITLELTNVGNNTIMLYKNMRIAQLCFMQLSSLPKRVYGQCDNKYQNQDSVTGSLIYWDSDTDKFGA